MDLMIEEAEKQCLFYIFVLFRIWNRLLLSLLSFAFNHIFHVHRSSLFVPNFVQNLPFSACSIHSCNANIWVHYFRKLMNPSLIETSNRTFIVVHCSKCVHQWASVIFRLGFRLPMVYTVEERDKKKKKPPDMNCQTQRADVTMRFHLV